MNEKYLTTVVQSIKYLYTLDVWCQMHVTEFFEHHTVFRYEEFASFMQSQGIDRPESWRQLLNYHKKAGNLIHIKKLLYAVKQKKDGWVDPFLIASKATPDAIISHHSALELHGLAYSTFTQIHYLTLRPIDSFIYENQMFRSVKFPKELIKINSTEFGLETFERQDMLVKLTGIERTVVDILDRSDLGGGWEEIWRSLDNITYLDLSKLIEYTLMLNNSTVVAKVGFFLDQRPVHFRGESKYIDELLQHIPKKPHYMNRSRREGGKYIKKWELIVPEEIIRKTWEEPSGEDI